MGYARYRGSVSALSAGAYVHHIFVVMVDIVKSGRAPPPPTLTRQGYFYKNEGMYARNWQLPLCVYSVVWPAWEWRSLDMKELPKFNFSTLSLNIQTRIIKI